MKRYTGQKALYEAISRSRAKAKRGSILERLRPEVPKPDKPDREEPGAREEPVQAPAEVAKPPVKRRQPPVVKPKPVEKAGPPASPGQTWLRPKPVQFNAGRIEISVPYHIAVPVALAMILAVLIAFKLGQIDQRTEASAPQAESAGTARAPAGATSESAAIGAGDRPEPAEATVPPGGGALAEGQRDHWIVLTQYKRKADLEAVERYFDDNGIDVLVVSIEEVRRVFADRGLNAGVLPSGEGYLLVTNGLYNNPENPGTDGYEMKKKIRDLGRGYKAPQGYESFAPHYFSDSYGMKITK
jgi:hypothetical protein